MTGKNLKNGKVLNLKTVINITDLCLLTIFHVSNTGLKHSILHTLETMILMNDLHQAVILSDFL